MCVERRHESRVEPFTIARPYTYRSRLDQQEHQRAFMQLYDRVRRDMEQANPLNGIAVWKGREGQRKGPADAWPFVSKDRTGDRDEPDGSDSFWTPQS